MLRIKQWHDYYDGKIYVSFSGGKDSTVLLHQVRKLYKNTPAVFVDTRVEYPEVKTFVKTIDNVISIKPSLLFKDIINKYGYPIISKENSKKIYELRNTRSAYWRHSLLHGNRNGNSMLPKKWQFLEFAPFNISEKCCYYLKKKPFLQYEKQTKYMPIIGTMASDSSLRKTQWLRNGCNVFNTK
jgi:hypothetical protein